MLPRGLCILTASGIMEVWAMVLLVLPSCVVFPCGRSLVPRPEGLEGLEGGCRYHWVAMVTSGELDVVQCGRPQIFFQALDIRAFRVVFMPTSVVDVDWLLDFRSGNGQKAQRSTTC